MPSVSKSAERGNGSGLEHRIWSRLRMDRHLLQAVFSTALQTVSRVIATWGACGREHGEKSDTITRQDAFDKYVEFLGDCGVELTLVDCDHNAYDGAHQAFSSVVRRAHPVACTRSAAPCRRWSRNILTATVSTLCAKTRCRNTARRQMALVCMTVPGKRPHCRICFQSSTVARRMAARISFQELDL
jgi:hypothetical protein